MSKEMSKAKVSWLLCIGRLVSKTDNVMHFASLVKQASVDSVSQSNCLFLAYNLATLQPLDTSHKIFFHKLGYHA